MCNGNNAAYKPSNSYGKTNCPPQQICSQSISIGEAEAKVAMSNVNFSCKQESSSSSQNSTSDKYSSESNTSTTTQTTTNNPLSTNSSRGIINIVLIVVGIIIFIVIIAVVMGLAMKKGKTPYSPPVP